MQPSRCTAPSRSSRSRQGAAPTGAWCLGLRGEPLVPQVPEPQSLGVSVTTGSRADQHRVPLPMEDQLKVMDSLYLHQTKFNTLSTIHLSIYHRLIIIPFPIFQSSNSALLLFFNDFYGISSQLSHILLEQSRAALHCCNW